MHVKWGSVGGDHQKLCFLARLDLPGCKVSNYVLKVKNAYLSSELYLNTCIQWRKKKTVIMLWIPIKLARQRHTSNMLSTHPFCVVVCLISLPFSNDEIFRDLFYEFQSIFCAYRNKILDSVMWFKTVWLLTKMTLIYIRY